MKKTHVLFPSQIDSTLDLPSLLTHSKATNAYITERTNGAISVAFTGTFANEHHMKSSLATIRQRDIRIVVGLFGEKDAIRVLCKVSIYTGTSCTCFFLWLQQCIEVMTCIMKCLLYFKANQMGLTTPDHVWILPSYFDPNWWKNSDTNCTDEEMKNILESIIFIGPVKYPPFLLSNQVS